MAMPKLMMASRMRARGTQAMLLVALVSLIWGLFGCAVITLMLGGAFEHVAINDSVMAAILATGTAFLASIGIFLAWLRSRRWPGRRR